MDHLEIVHSQMMRVNCLKCTVTTAPEPDCTVALCSQQLFFISRAVASATALSFHLRSHVEENQGGQNHVCASFVVNKGFPAAEMTAEADLHGSPAHSSWPAFSSML